MSKPVVMIKKKLLFVLVVLEIVIVILMGKVFYIQAFEAESLQGLAAEQHTRDRLITPNRGSILDRNGIGIAVTESVCSVSVIPVQLRGQEEKVALELAQRLDMDYDTVYEKVSKNVALERIKIKVDKEIADEIRTLDLPGVVVDEDVKRTYPYYNLASHVVGFVGRDNQGIIGLESQYEKYLQGSYGKILTETDARGINLDGRPQKRIEPIAGYNLVTTLDVTVQQYAEQTLAKAVEAKSATRGAIIVLNPQNGEIYALANEPNFDLNDPFTINSEELSAVWDTLNSEDQNTELNKMWRNFVINDTYEPGSTFKIITTAAGLSEKVVGLDDHFNCNGYHMVGDRMIKCWRYPRVHGAETFVEGVQNSCNPVFMIVAERLGAETFYQYMHSFGFSEKTGVDLPGEAVGIMHDLKNVGPVELATMSFGQSFQITPLQLLRAASSTVNGGYLITPHVGMKVVDDEGQVVEEFSYDKGRQVISEETSELMKEILESVVSVGTGNRTYIPGYRIGGKTATSQKLPRGNGKYIASFLAFAPAENPQVMALIMIDEPEGVYYGGTVVGPVMKELLENILPYLGVSPVYTEEELLMEEVAVSVVPDIIGMHFDDAKKELTAESLQWETRGSGNKVVNQFPEKYETVNPGSRIIIYLEETEEDVQEGQ